MTLKGNLNPWNDMNDIVETIPEFCVHEDQAKEVERQYVRQSSSLFAFASTQSICANFFVSV